MPFQPLWDFVLSPAGCTHGRAILHVFDQFDGAPFVLVQKRKPIEFHDLPNNFQRWLIPPFVDFRHGQIIQKDRHFHAVGWAKCFPPSFVQTAFNGDLAIHAFRDGTEGDCFGHSYVRVKLQREQ